MLIISIFMLILASASPVNHITKSWDSLFISRIVFILLLFSAYIVYNTMYVESVITGLGIYGGVFGISLLSHSFDIIILLTGSIVTLLTCYIPFYTLKKITTDRTLFDLWKNYLYINSTSYMLPANIMYENVILEKMKANKEWLDLNKDIYKKYEYLNYVNEIKEYSILLLFTIIGASLLISAQNLISIYLSLELQSFTLYIIAASRIESFKSTSGGLKYFLLGGLSSGFILFGFSILYAYTGTLNLDSIFMIYSGSYNFFIDVCLLFIFGGLLFKVSAAPFHNWAPDVYSDVPTISTTWLIVIAKLSILIIILLLIHNINYSLNLNTLSFINIDINNIYIYNIEGEFNNIGLWTNLITLSACLSLIFGTLVGLSQGLTKRLLAYSTISHVGFLLAALSINSVISIDAFIFYLIQYTLTNLNVFFILITWGYNFTFYFLEEENNSEWLFSPVPAITQLKGMHYTDSFLAFSLAISIFSLAGIPPLIGFFAKQQILLASMQVDYYFLSFLIINTSVIGAAYYLRLIKFIYFFDKVFSSNKSNFYLNNDNKYWSGSSTHISLIIALFTNIILFFIFKPYLFIDFIHLISISLHI